MSKVKIKFNPLPTQAKVFDDDHTKTIMQSMGLGGGKTYNLCMKMLKLSQQNKGYSGGILAPSFPELKKDILPTFEDILDTHRIKYKYHKTDKYFKFPWSKGLLYCFSAEKQIAGPNLAYCGINEFSLIPYTRVNEMLRRVRVKNAPVKQRIMVGTPEDQYGWLEEFIEKMENDGNFQIHFGDTDENTYIDEDYGKDLEALLDEKSLEVFKAGKIGRLGTDYFYFSYDRLKNVTDKINYHPDLTIDVGLDFNVGQMAISFSHKIMNEQHFFDEKLLIGDSSTYSVVDFLNNCDYPKAMMVISCDSTGKARKTVGQKNLMSDVAILRAAGFNLRVKTVNPRLRPRQILMNGMLYHGRIKIHPRCKEIIKDFKTTKQKDDFTKDEGSKHNRSHFSDGCDYVCDHNHATDLITGRSGSYRR